MMLIQWVTFAVYTVVFALCLAAGWRYAWARAMAGAWAAVALNTAVFYLVAFLAWPERVGPEATMIWSLALRMHVALTILWRLYIVVRRDGRWNQ